MLYKSILGYRSCYTASILPYNNKPFHTIDIYMIEEERTKKKEQALTIFLVNCMR